MRWLIVQLTLLQLQGEFGSVFYPPYEKNFWLEFGGTSTTTSKPVTIWKPRPVFQNPGYNGTIHTVTLGQTTHIDCQVKDLHGYQVSWLKKVNGTMDLLTTEHLVFSADARYSVVYTPPDNWKLVIKSSQTKDSATYLCQVNSHPPTFIMVKLLVIVPSLQMIDDMGDPVTEKYFKPGGTIVLRCLVANYRDDFHLPVWFKDGVKLIGERTGRRVKYEYGRDGSLELRLYLVGAGAQDTGNYTCTIPGIDISRAAVSLFLTLGEETAAVYSQATHLHFGSTSLVFIISFLNLIVKF